MGSSTSQKKNISILNCNWKVAPSLYLLLADHISIYHMVIVTFKKGGVRAHKAPSWNPDILRPEEILNLELFTFISTKTWAAKTAEDSMTGSFYWTAKLASSYGTTENRARFPVGAVSRKSVRVSEVIFHLPPATLQAWYGGIQKGLVWTGELSVFALSPVTRHNKELVEAQPWTNRSITHPPAFTAHMHTQVDGGH